MASVIASRARPAHRTPLDGTGGGNGSLLRAARNLDDFARGAAHAQPGKVKLAGLIGFQTCQDEKGCDLPQAAQFQVEVPVAVQSIAGALPLEFSAGESYKQVGTAATIGATDSDASAGPVAGFDADKLEANVEKGETSLVLMLGAALWAV